MLTNESCNFTVGARQADTLVDTAGEMGDAVLKVLPVDLHDIGFVLDDSDFGGFSTQSIKSVHSGLSVIPGCSQKA